MRVCCGGGEGEGPYVTQGACIGMAWNRQESRVLTVLKAQESGKARESGLGSTQSVCRNVAHTESPGGCEGAKGIGKQLETAKIAFSGLRERAGISVGQASQQTL